MQKPVNLEIVIFDVQSVVLLKFYQKQEEGPILQLAQVLAQECVRVTGCQRVHYLCHNGI